MTATGVGSLPRAVALVAALLTLALAPLPAQQPLQPAPPAKYKVKLRYRIIAPRDQHVQQYDALVDFLEGLKFEFDPAIKRPESDREDVSKNEFQGLLPPGNPLRLFANPSVAAVVMMPDDFKLPADVNERVKVRLELVSGFAPDRQRMLAEQTRVLLEEVDFREAFGYDHRGYTGQPHTRLVGTVPLHQLDMLLKDLRTRPGGWFAPLIDPADLPQPIRQVNPVRITEVLRETAPAKDIVIPELPDPPFLEKLSPELMGLLAEKDGPQTPVSLEVILAITPKDDDPRWVDVLKGGLPGVFVEGRLGPVVTVFTQAGNARRLAALPLVSSIRLQERSRNLAAKDAVFPADNQKVLEQSGVARLHQLGKLGKITIPGTIHYPKAKERPVRVAILDNDFTGYAEMVKLKLLPPDTRLVDLTIQWDPEILPAPPYPEVRQLGHGTQCALAVALAAPEAQLTLVRVDPASPYQIQEVAQYINGAPLRSQHLDRRVEELNSYAGLLASRRTTILQERKAVFEIFQDETGFDEEYGLLGPTVTGWVFSGRQWHFRRLEELERDEKAHRFRELRYQKLLSDLATLRGIDLVCCTLNFPDRYPLSGSSALSRWFDQTPQKALWFQSAGNFRGQTWYGPYRDADSNGVMEFAPPTTKPGKGRWTNELNFLKWEALTPKGDKGPARIRVSVQWREPHDPDYFFRADEPDLYRKPLASLRPVVVRQRDPAGKDMASDDCEPVAVAFGAAQRLDNRPNMATYEQAVEFTAERGARYAVLIVRQQPERWQMVQEPGTGRLLLVLERGLTSTGIRPLGAPTLPALEKQWELWPRLFVECIDPVASTEGRMVFEDFSTEQGDIGMLADARTVVTVGAAGLAGKRQPYSSAGPPANVVGCAKPNVLAYDALDVVVPGLSKVYGSDVATAFATGEAACMMSAGMSRQQLTQFLLSQNGAVLRVPESLQRK
jgi:hypothetical protein